MRMIGYYALHSFLNQLKKIFKSWVLIFILACALIGGLAGYIAGTLSEAAEERIEESADESEDAEDAEAVLEFTFEADVDDLLENAAGEENASAISGFAIMELVIGAVLLGIFVYLILSADKNGGKIFLPADVNLLFPSPLSPQRVLFFRLMMQAGAAIFASVYLLFQIPNLCYNLGLSLVSAFMLVFVWGLTILTAKFLQVLIYTVTSTRTELKRYIAPVVYSVLAVILVAFAIFWRSSSLSPLQAAIAFFNGKYSRFIPVWGWLKGFAMYAAEQNMPGALLCAAGSILTLFVLIFVIRRTKADFYEDAMAKSEQTAELMEAMQSGRKLVATSKKTKSEKLRRDGLSRGWGASVFFHKALYNRFRFAKLGYFTKTTITYLFASAAAALLFKTLVGTDSILPVVFVLAVFVFYRAMGNPLEEDTKMDFFRMIPESPESKIFWSLLGGTVNCALDLLPAMILGTVLLGANPLKMFIWLPFIISIDFYATNTSTFINLAIPSSVDKTIKQIVTIMFLYFGLLPNIGIMAVGVIFEHTGIAAIVCVALNIVFGLLFLLLASVLLAPKGGSPVRAKVGEFFGNLKEVSRKCSRIGISLAVIYVLAFALQYLIGLLLNRFVPGWNENPYIFWPASFLPLYLCAVPTGVLLMRKVPADPVRKQEFSFGRWVKAFFIGVFFMYTGSFLGLALNMLFTGSSAPTDLNPLLRLLGRGSVVLQLLVTVILAPIIEEFIFRKCLLTRLRRYGEALAVVTSALCFGLFHGNLQQTIYATLLGLVLGYVYIRSGKLKLTILLHMAINALGNFASILLLSNDKLSSIAGGDFTAMQPEEMMKMLPTLLLLIVYALFLVGGWIAGLVLFILNVRRLVFEPTEEQLPRGKGFKTEWGNIGMILFTIICIASILQTLLGIAIF